MTLRTVIPVVLLLIAAPWPFAAQAQTAEETDSASLAQLHDIVVPDGVDLWWPPAPGWYAITALVVVLVAWGLWRIRKQRKATRYRLEALAEIRALRHERRDPQVAVSRLLILLKRTALAAYPREMVAGLSGETWWDFLDRSGANGRFAAGLGDLAEQLVYARQGADAISARDLRRLYKAAEHWIKRHRPADSLAVRHGAEGGAPAAVTPQVGG